MLQAIDRLKIDAKKEGQAKKGYKLLQMMSRPKRLVELLLLAGKVVVLLSLYPIVLIPVLLFLLVSCLGLLLLVKVKFINKKIHQVATKRWGGSRDPDPT